MHVSVFVEIPKGSRNKYELDKEKGVIKFDRMLYSAMHYPSDYGFIEDTMGEDGDPLDALVVMWEPTFPGCLIEAKVLGVFKMSDEKGNDEKVITVPVKDPLWNHVNSLEDLPPHYMKELQHFFEVYKDLEGKKVHVRGWGNAAEAEQLIEECRERYKSLQKAANS